MKLKEENLPIRSGMFDTCPIVESDSVVKKRLSDIDCFALRYAAMELVKENFEFEEFNLDVLSAECWTATPIMFAGLAPCAVYGMLNDLGYMVSCESDIHCAITMALLCEAQQTY